MRHDNAQPDYERKYYPQNLREFKEALRMLCLSYGCFLTVVGSTETLGIEHEGDGFRVYEDVERKDYWQCHYDSEADILENCTRIGGVPMKEMLGRIGFQVIGDFA